MQRCVLPDTCKLYKVPSLSGVEREITDGSVNNIVYMDGALSLVAALDIGVFGELAGYVPGEQGEIWRTISEPTRGVGAMPLLESYKNLYDRQTSRVAYAEGMQSVLYYKKVYKLYSENAAYSGVDSILVYKNGFEKYSGEGYPFAIIGYAELDAFEEPIYSGATLEPGEGRVPVLIKYDFEREEEYAAQEGAVKMTIPVSNLWMNLFADSAVTGISSATDTTLPVLPEAYQKGRFVLVYSRTLVDALAPENPMDRIFVKPTSREGGLDDETGVVRFVLKTSKYNSVPYEGDDGYEVKQYYIGNGSFASGQSAASEPGLVEDTHISKGIPIGNLDETVPVEYRVELPTSATSVILEIKDGISGENPKAVMYSRLFEGLREFSPELDVDMSGSVWADVLAPRFD